MAHGKQSESQVGEYKSIKVKRVKKSKSLRVKIVKRVKKSKAKGFKK